MKTKDIIRQIEECATIHYREKVAFTRELYKNAIELLNENSIDVNDENAFTLIKDLKNNEGAQEILDALEYLNYMHGMSNEYVMDVKHK